MLVIASWIPCRAESSSADEDNKPTPEQVSIYDAELAKVQQSLAAAISSSARIELQSKIAFIYLKKGDFDRSESLAEACIAQAEQEDLKLPLAQSRAVLGTLYNERGYYDQAQLVFKQALPVLEEGGDVPSLLRCLNGLAIISGRAKEYPSAITLFERASTLAKDNGDHERYLILLQNMAWAYGQMGQLERARQLTEEALHLIQGAPDRVSEAGLHTDLGEFLLQEKKPAEALVHLEIAERLCRENGDKRSLAATLFDTCEALRGVGRLAEASQCLHEIESLVAGMGASERFEIRVTEQKALLAAAQGDWQAAYEASQRHSQLSLQNQERLLEGRVRESGLYLERRLKDQELRLVKEDGAKLEAALQVSRQRQYLLWGASAALLVIGGVSVYLYRASLRAEKQAHDVTEAARAAAEASAALKTRLLRMAAHDLRSPLTVISSAANLLELEDHSPGQRREFARMIADASDKMTRLLEDLLSQAAKDDGTLRVQAVPTEMRAFLGETVAGLGALLARKQQRLSFASTQLERVFALVDSVRLWQVFENLISNASKFSPPGVDIELLLEETDSWVRCGVRDRGPGIPAEERGQLFRPFTRGSAQPTGGERSTGLGLSIAKEIVELHHGRIQIDSVPGRGATFWVELPRVAAAPAVV